MADTVFQEKEFDPYAQWLGIGPEEQPPHNYRLLGLPPFESDLAKIAAAADERMRHVRKFQLGQRSSVSQAILNQLAAAKVCLSNSQTKAVYDAALKTHLEAPLPPPAPGEAPPPPVLPPDPALFSQPVDPGGGPTPFTTPDPQSVTLADAFFDPGQPAAAEPNAVKPNAKIRKKSSQRLTQMILWAVVCGLVLFLVIYVVAPPSRAPSSKQGGPTPINLNKNPNDDRSLAGKTVIVGEGMVVQGEDDHVLLPADKAKTSGRTLRVLAGNIGNWTNGKDRVEWDFILRKGGIYMVEVTYAADSDSAGGEAIIRVGGRQANLSVRDSGGLDKYRTDETQMVVLKRPDRYQLVVMAGKKPGAVLMNLKSIRLRRAKTP